MSDTASRLLTCGTATVYEAMARRPPLPPTIRPVWTCSLAGPAFTLEASRDDNLAFHRAVADAPAGAVIVGVVAPGEAAIFGSLLARVCRDKGIAGVVTNGLVRDTDAIRDLRFPVFAGGVTIAGPAKIDAGVTGTCVTIGCVSINPGDWILGDGDGVVVVPVAILASTLDAAEAIEAREAEMVRRAREGVSTLEQLGPQPA